MKRLVAGLHIQPVIDYFFSMNIVSMFKIRIRQQFNILQVLKKSKKFMVAGCVTVCLAAFTFLPCCSFNFTKKKEQKIITAAMCKKRIWANWNHSSERMFLSPKMHISSLEHNRSRIQQLKHQIPATHFSNPKACRP